MKPCSDDSSNAERQLRARPTNQTIELHSTTAYRISQLKTVNNSRKTLASIVPRMACSHGCDGKHAGASIEAQIE